MATATARASAVRSHLTRNPGSARRCSATSWSLVFISVKFTPADDNSAVIAALNLVHDPLPARVLRSRGVSRYPLVMATRERVSVDLDAEVAAILRKHAAEAHLTEGEILDRALRAYDLRALLARLQSQSDLDDDAAMALAREELKAVRAARRAAD